MTLLDQQMKNDLQERLSGKSTISAAENIAVAIKDDVSAKGLPSYFFGDRDAKTVVVNLNPGEAAEICDKEWKCRTEGFGNSLDRFIEKYIERQRTYGIIYGLTDTRNPRDRQTGVEDLLLPGDVNGYPRNFCDGLNPEGGHWLAGGVKSSDTTRSVYNLIVNNADVIKGVFAGHCHSDMYNEIVAKNSDGTAAVIPQYITTSNAYDGGHAMRIFVD